jgi:hypothetical protein
METVIGEIIVDFPYMRLSREARVDRRALEWGTGSPLPRIPEGKTVGSLLPVWIEVHVGNVEFVR